MSGTVTAMRPQFLDNFGGPVAGGSVHYYEAGTTTPLDTFADAELTTPNPNPVVLDGAGRASIFLTPDEDYRIVLEDAEGNTIWTQDGVAAPATQPAVTHIPLYGSAVRGRDDAAYQSGFTVNDLIVGTSIARISADLILGTWRLEAIARLTLIGDLTIGLFNLDAQTGPLVEITKTFAPLEANTPLELVSDEFEFPDPGDDVVRYGLKQRGEGLALVYAAALRRIQ